MNKFLKEYIRSRKKVTENNVNIITILPHEANILGIDFKEILKNSSDLHIRSVIIGGKNSIDYVRYIKSNFGSYEIKQIFGNLFVENERYLMVLLERGEEYEIFITDDLVNNFLNYSNYANLITVCGLNFKYFNKFKKKIDQYIVNDEHFGYNQDNIEEKVFKFLSLIIKYSYDFKFYSQMLQFLSFEYLKKIFNLNKENIIKLESKQFTPLMGKLILEKYPEYFYFLIKMIKENNLDDNYILYLLNNMKYNISMNIILINIIDIHGYDSNIFDSILPDSTIFAIIKERPNIIPKMVDRIKRMDKEILINLKNNFPEANKYLNKYNI